MAYADILGCLLHGVLQVTEAGHACAWWQIKVDRWAPLAATVGTCEAKLSCKNG